MPTIRIISNNYAGDSANIVFYAQGSNTPVPLGTQTIPYTRTATNVYGRYVLTFASTGTTCEANFDLISTTTTTAMPSSFTLIGEIDGEATDDQSGYSVAFNYDGTVLAIGSPYHDFAKGQVNVYFRSGSSWSKRGNSIENPLSLSNSLFGNSVALSSSGNVLAIGSVDGYDGFGERRGYVEVYTWNGSSWTQRGSTLIGSSNNSDFGSSVSLSADGNILAVGEPLADHLSLTNVGMTRIYYWGGSNWILRGNIVGEAAGDYSGFSVNLSSSGNTIAIGAPINGGNGSQSGHVRVYDWDGSSWTQRGVDIDGEASLDRSGSVVSLSADGNIVAIGAASSPGGAARGQVKIYSWNGSAWIQRGADIDGEAAGDSSGGSVSLNNDGNIVAIGARNANFSVSGHVRIYSWSGSAWTQLGSDIDGEGINDYSGASVSLSGDGTRVAIGAPYNDGANGVDSGHVRIYQIQ
jgi:hypothetical protein